MEPLLVPPSQFSMINEGLYTGAYPEHINYPFLDSSGLHLFAHIVVFILNASCP